MNAADPHGDLAAAATHERVSVDRLTAPRELREQLAEDVAAGFTTTPRRLPSTYFYDETGSELFEQITALPEYYLTRAETAILEDHAPELVRHNGAGDLLELGSGSSRKTRLLLEAMATAHGPPVSYTPLDVSEDALAGAARALVDDYPWLHVNALIGDFHTDLATIGPSPEPRLVAFLGSTLGNLAPKGRQRLLEDIARLLSGGDHLLLGADLVKDPAVLRAAYDDAAGVTARFNRNVLRVINRHLGADFEPARFDHEARWNAGEERIEMWLVATEATTVTIPAADLTVAFRAGDGIRTELSCKFRREGLEQELAAAGLRLERFLTDPGEGYSLSLVTRAGRR